MRRFTWMLFALLFVAGCVSNGPGYESNRKAEAERFLRGLYGGDGAVVSQLAADDIVISYPGFQEILGTPAVRGLDAARAFADGFSRRWVDQHITIHEAIAEGDRVVVVWSFRARNTEAGGSDGSDQPQGQAEQAWGGITLYRFDADGKIAVELGEESTPGPYARLARGSEDE